MAVIPGQMLMMLAAAGAGCLITRVHLRWDVLDGRLSWSFDQDKIVAEKLFDGCYIVSGQVPKEKMAASEVVASYKKLGLVEEAFRSLKTVQLEVRPRLPQDR